MLEDEKVESITNKYVNLLTKNGANVILIDNWGRKKFAYAIKKRLSGFYISIEFTAPSGVISKLEKAFHIDDNILRFLTVHYDKSTYKERQGHLEKKAVELANRETEPEVIEEQLTNVFPEEFPDIEEKSE